MTTHKEPEEKEIPELCKQTFISSKTGLGILWVLAGVLISMSGTAVGWAMATSNDVTKLKSEQSYLESKQDKLDADINKKLDILINRGK